MYIIVKDRHGGYYITAGNAVYHYDSLGRKQKVGGPTLPPLFAVPYVFGLHVDSNDSLFVLGGEQLVVFNRERKAVRQSRADWGGFLDGPVLRLPSGEWLGTRMGHWGPMQKSGKALHVFAKDGKYARSLGAELPPILGHEPRFQQVLSNAASSSIWAGYMTKYQLDRWSYSGDHVQTLTRKVDWFTEWPESMFEMKPSRPGKYDNVSSIRGIYQRSPTELWVLIKVPRSTRLASTDSTPGSMVERFESVLEVIDPVKGLLIASQRIPQTFYGFTNDGDLVGVEENDVYMYAKIWRARFVNPAIERKK
jgi:hypothetical protein